MDDTLQQRAFRRMVEAMIALFGLLIIGTVGYRWLEDMTTIDALYMAVITVSTVGFGEVKQLTPAGRLFTIILIVGGGGVAAYALSAAAEFFFSGAWRVQLEQRRKNSQLAKLHHHAIVCGYGRVGKHVVDELQAQNMAFVVIDPDPEKIACVEETGHLALRGDAANEADLYTAGIERAHSLVATASSDAENVFIVLTARSLRSDIVIVARGNSDTSEEKLIRAGANRVLLPYRICGQRMVTLLIRPDVADFLDEVAHASQLELLVGQVHLAPDSPLVGQTLGQADLRNKVGVTVLACRSPGNPINTSPSASTLLQANAQLIVLATHDHLQALIALASGKAERLPE